ncbi:MAG: HNH endonuclease [Pseudomonadota bacterium]
MAIKVHKVADIVDSMIIFCHRSKGFRPGDVAAILTNCQPVDNPKPGFQWQIELEIKIKGVLKNVKLELASVISVSDSLDSPVFIGNGQLIFYQNQLFMAEREPRNGLDQEEIFLRVKKIFYDQEVSLANLRSAVANIEAAIEYKKSGPKREKINDDVKLIVWARDGGACVRCGAKQNLHFDHIIPLAMGGGNTEKNIQILCEVCNLKKAAKLTTT